MSLVRILLGLVALASISSQAGATRLWKGGAGVVASTCSAGDFFTAVDGSGNFTCATPSGSGDITAVGDCATGACFSGTTGSTLTGATGTSLVLNTDNNIYLSFDTDNNSTATGVVIGSNASGSSATPYVVVSDAAGKNVTLRNATTLRINDPSDDTNYTEIAGASGIAANFTATLPAETGTICTTGSVCSGYQASGSYAPANATYITQTANATLTNEQAMGSLGTGLVINTTTTGVQSIYAGSGTCGASTWFTALSASGAKTCTQPAFTDISGSVTDAQVPNTITVDLATLATTATTANAGDSATSFFSSGELERTLLPAASADCTANRFAKGVDADFVLDCAQPAFTDISGSVTDAQVPDTITLDNITQITTRAHSSLSSLTSGDDHTQYALLAGRSGGQTLIGGTASGNDLTLQSTSNATRGSIFFGSEWEWLDQIPDAADGTTYSGGLWNPTLSITGAAGTTSYVFGLDLNPTVNLDDAAGTSISFMGAMRARGTFTRSGAATYVPAFYLLFADAVNTSATDGLGPMGTALIYDNLLNSYTSTGSTTATLGRASTVWSNHIIQTNGDASTRLDVGSDYGFYWTTHLSETTGILNVTNVIGAKFETPALGGTTPQITTIAAVDIDKMTGAATDAGNIGIRNKSTTVFAPTTTQAIAAAGNTITCDETYKKFTTATGTTVMTSNPTITDGATGQICILQNVDATATDCITLTDSTVGMQLAGNDTLCPNDTITLVYDGTDWVETARSNN